MGGGHRYSSLCPRPQSSGISCRPSLTSIPVSVHHHRSVNQSDVSILSLDQLGDGTGGREAQVRDDDQGQQEILPGSQGESSRQIPPGVTDHHQRRSQVRSPVFISTTPPAR